MKTPVAGKATSTRQLSIPKYLLTTAVIAAAVALPPAAISADQGWPSVFSGSQTRGGDGEDECSPKPPEWEPATDEGWLEIPLELDYLVTCHEFDGPADGPNPAGGREAPKQLPAPRRPLFTWGATTLPLHVPPRILILANLWSGPAYVAVSGEVHYLAENLTTAYATSGSFYMWRDFGFWGDPNGSKNLFWGFNRGDRARVCVTAVSAFVRYPPGNQGARLRMAGSLSACDEFVVRGL